MEIMYGKRLSAYELQFISNDKRYIKMVKDDFIKWLQERHGINYRRFSKSYYLSKNGEKILKKFRRYYMNCFWTENEFKYKCSNFWSRDIFVKRIIVDEIIEYGCKFLLENYMPPRIYKQPGPSEPGRHKWEHWLTRHYHGVKNHVPRYTVCCMIKPKFRFLKREIFKSGILKHDV